jgi:predicted alpha/beta-hydrolase family hydrolase
VLSGADRVGARDSAAGASSCDLEQIEANFYLLFHCGSRVGAGHIPKAMTNMKRGTTVFLSIGALLTVGYFTVSKWAIRHENLTFYDPDRDNRPVAVDIAIRRDKQMQADAGLIKLPVAVFSHGNTVKSTEYSFINNVFAAHGYMVLSIQHDLPTDPPMVTKPGEPYVGRLPQILRGVANIKFAVQEMQKVKANADYDHLTMVGHSMGGDITMYFAKQYPDEVRKVVTLDNLRVPFITSGKFKILSFRSHDPQFKTDPGVIPSKEECEKDGITVVDTNFQHNDMRDTGSIEAKASIETMLDKFLTDTDNSAATPVGPSTANIVAPVPTYVPVN